MSRSIQKSCRRTAESPGSGFRASALHRLGGSALVFFLCLASPSSTEAGPRWADFDSTTGRLEVERTLEKTLRLRAEVGEPLNLPLAAGSRFHRLEASAGRFWITATEPRTTGGAAVTVLRGEGRQIERLSPPVAIDQGLLLEPTPLLDDGRLLGLLWLEGDRVRSLAVRAATWTGSSWTAPVTVAEPGPGTQIALRAIVLDDGSWLAAWSAFDGEDDEILWSRARNGRWDPPASVAPSNQVPDITPDLVAIDGGAVLAWSRFFPGERYRIVTATFDGTSWASASPVAGSGTHFPELHAPGSALPGRSLLVYRQSQPGEWVVSEIDSGGNVLRRASVASDNDSAPLILGVDERGPEVSWPGSEAEKAGAAISLPWTDAGSP